MGLGARGFLTLLALGVVLGVALLKVFTDSADPEGEHESSNVSVEPSTASVSPNNVTTTTLKPAGKSSENKDSSASHNGIATTSKPIATSKVITPVISTNTTSTTLSSTPKIANVSQNTSQLSVSTVTTAHNSSMTSVPSSVTVTATIISKENKGSKFDTGSFVGGIVLTLGVLSFLYIGCKVYYSRRGIRYRTIDEHDAII
uniref:Uncharacterized protein n=1 Tax=Rangifer tarandus platyrhynchus TaxID=3082113 RepID=A0ACB0DTW0_RANTA|nr:unnamed protein product [Rangifer tarandus platyrhynchus]